MEVSEENVHASSPISSPGSGKLNNVDIVIGGHGDTKADQIADMNSPNGNGVAMNSEETHSTKLDDNIVKVSQDIAQTEPDDVQDQAKEIVPTDPVITEVDVSEDRSQQKSPELVHGFSVEEVDIKSEQTKANEDEASHADTHIGIDAKYTPPLAPETLVPEETSGISPVPEHDTKPALDDSPVKRKQGDLEQTKPADNAVPVSMNNEEQTKISEHISPTVLQNFELEEKPISELGNKEKLVAEFPATKEAIIHSAEPENITALSLDSEESPETSPTKPPEKEQEDMLGVDKTAHLAAKDTTPDTSEGTSATVPVCSDAQSMPEDTKNRNTEPEEAHETIPLAEDKKADEPAAVVSSSELPSEGNMSAESKEITSSDLVSDDNQMEHCAPEETKAESNGTAAKNEESAASEQTVKADTHSTSEPEPETEETEAAKKEDSKEGTAAKNEESAASEQTVKPDTHSTSEPETEETEAARKEDSKEEKWTYVLGHEKLKKRTLQAGKGIETRPMHGQIVTIRYVGKLLDGDKEVDSHDAFSFVLGDGDVIQALDLATALMQAEETAEIITEAQYAYGSQGREPDIPGDAKLKYEVTLLKADPAPEYAQMPIQQRMEEGDKKREKGNWFYSRGEYPAAINAYTKAVKIVDNSQENQTEEASELQKLMETRLKCFNNLAAAQIKVEAWEAAIKSCDEVLKVQPENVKALFRKGKCYAGKDDIGTAIAILKKALKLEPETKIIHQELARLVTQQKARDQSEKNLYKKMLGTTDPKKKASQKDSRWMMYAGAVTAGFLAVGLAAYRYVHW